MSHAARRLGWGICAILILVDQAWGGWIGLSIAGWGRCLLAVAGLVLLAALYRHRSVQIAAMAELAALWIGFSAAAAMLTYLCATPPRPLFDASLARLDHALGYDWARWRHIVLTTPWLRWPLWLAYFSLLPQILLGIVALPLMNRSGRGVELFLLSALTLLPTAVIAGIWPALGPLALAEPANAVYLPDLLALRGPGPWHFALATLQGIITMPSYHTVLALLFVNAFRGTGGIGRAVLGLNLVMLLSISPIGGHYLVDMLAGAALAAAGIIGMRLAEARFRPQI